MGIRSWISWRGKDIGYGLLGKLLWPRCSAAAVVIEDEKILAIDTGDYLMLPGGGIESGESFRETAERETREETGVEIEVQELLMEQENSVGGVEKIFRGRPVNSKATGGHWEGEPSWISLDRALERQWRHDRDIGRLADATGKS
ncbi:MAG: NUDIX domain-containing protein [Candidatus Nanohaloarchaea archaeon]